MNELNNREQYSKGYKDCKTEMLAKIKQARKQIDDLIYIESYVEPYSVIEDVLKIIDKLIKSEVRNGTRRRIRTDNRRIKL